MAFLLHFLGLRRFPLVFLSDRSGAYSLLLILCERRVGCQSSDCQPTAFVPGPGLEPGWIAPTVFETVASTDSAIRALWRLSLRGKGRDFYLNNIKRGEIF